jgi:hypothetical protein
MVTCKTFRTVLFAYFVDSTMFGPVNIYYTRKERKEGGRVACYTWECDLFTRRTNQLSVCCHSALQSPSSRSDP